MSHPPSDPPSVQPPTRAVTVPPQVTYDGHPFYAYTADRNLGDTSGQGLDAFGGDWFAVDAAARQVSGAGTGDAGRLGS